MSTENQKTQHRNEADLGKKYERHVFALISLKCLLHPGIKDFWITSNVSEIKKFDDIVLNITYKENEINEIYLMQVKNKEKSTKAVVANMFANNQKDFNLKMYEEAYDNIIRSEKISNLLNRKESTKICFLLLNNCEINKERENNKLEFKGLDSTSFKKFLSTKTYEESTCYKLIDKCENFDPEFLESFYFYPEQLQLDNICEDIKTMLCNEHTIAKIFISNFITFPQHAPNDLKLTKTLLKMEILQPIFGNFQPPKVSMENGIFINVINKFNITVINEDASETKIWSEILFLMQKNFDESLDFHNWNNKLPENVQKGIKEKFPILKHKDLSVDLLYLFMVSTADLPFYKKSDDRSLNVFTLLVQMGIYSVFYNTEKNKKIDFPHEFKIFKTMKDMPKNVYYENIKHMFVSFRKENEISLADLKLDREIDEFISVDQYIQLYKSTLSVKHDDLVKSDFYINRTLKSFAITEDIFRKNENIVYYIFNVSPHTEIAALKYFYDLGSVGIYNKYCYVDNTEFMSLEDLEKYSTIDIFISIFPYQPEYLNILEKLHTRKNILILQYDDIMSDHKKIFNLIYTTYNVNKLEQFTTPIPIKDEELINFLSSKKVNIICNNAGMGKTMLLKYLFESFASQEWLIYLELRKYCRYMNSIKTVEDLMQFIYDNNLVRPSDSTYELSFRYLYKWYATKLKFILLIDDFEEILDKELINVFKEAAKGGLRMWIVSRSQMKEEFQNTFGILSLELEDFTEKNKLSFFKKYFRNKNKKISNKTIKTKINKIYNKNSFIGICQQTMMLAIIFDIDKEFQLTGIHNLYETFFKVILKQNYTYPDFALIILSKLALTNFFDELFLKKIFDWDEFQVGIHLLKNELKKIPLVVINKDGNMDFSHKTYPEFLAGRWLSIAAKKQIIGQHCTNFKGIIRDLYSRELTNVRWFFDHFIKADKWSVINKLTDPVAIYNVDILGRNILHYKLTYGKRFDLKLIMDSGEQKVIQNKDEVSVTVPQTINENTHYNFTISHQSATENCSKSSNISSLIFLPDQFLNITAFDCVLLAENLEKVEDLLCESHTYDMANFTNYCFKYQVLLLYYAVRNGFKNILRKLLSINQLAEKSFMIKEQSTKMSLLHLAVQHRQFECVNIFLELFPAHKYGQDEEGNTAIHLAARWKDVPLTTSSSEKCIVNTKSFTNKNGENILDYDKANNVECVTMLLKDKTVDVNMVNNQGNSAFIESIKNSNLTMCQILHDHGADVNLSNNKEMTALHFAVLRSKSKILKQLLDWTEVDVNCQNEHGLTPLMFAVRKNRKDAVKLLLNKSDINLTDQKEWTVLHHAVKMSNTEIVQLLLTRKEINLDHKNQFTPLMIALKEKKADIVNLLLNGGCDINVRDKNKKTALHHAVKINNVEIVKLLIENNAAVNVFDKQRVTPLMIAIKEEKSDIVNLLLSHGCDINLRDKNKRTALHYAVEIRNTEIVKALIKNAAKINIVDKNGVSPLKQAINQNVPDIIEILTPYKEKEKEKSTKFYMEGLEIHSKISKIFKPKFYCNKQKRYRKNKIKLIF